METPHHKFFRFPGLKVTRMFLRLHCLNGLCVERLWECVVTAWVSECGVFESVTAILFLYKNLHSDLIWSGLSPALLWSEMIWKALASLRGDEQQARC